MTLLEWLSLAGLCFAGAASPGPSLAVVVAASLHGGRASGLSAAWAHALGVALYAAATVLGISALLAANDWVLLVLQVSGALYLLWLAGGIWRSSADAAAPPDRAPTQKLQSAARDGFAIAFLNPKLAIFMLALFSQYVRPDAGLEVQAQLIATAGIIDGLWYSVVALVFSRGPWISRLQQNARRIDQVFALLLSALALYILFTVVRALLV